MFKTIIIISLGFAAAFSCTSASADQYVRQLLYQAQMLQRIKQGANVGRRVETRRPQFTYRDSRRSFSQTG
jgi:hypothetical protein